MGTFGGRAEINNPLSKGEGLIYFFKHMAESDIIFHKKSVSASGDFDPTPTPYYSFTVSFYFFQTNKILSFRFLYKVCSSTYSSVAV